MLCATFSFGCFKFLITDGLRVFLDLNRQPFRQYLPADEESHYQPPGTAGQGAAESCIKTGLQEQVGQTSPGVD